MNVECFLATVTQMLLAITQTDHISVIVKVGTLAMELFAQVNNVFVTKKQFVRD